MVIFTTADYWRYQTIFPVKQMLKDTNEKYELEKEQKKKETHQYHDKIFKELLDNKKEFINFISRYTDDKQKKNLIRESEIEKYNRKFITANFTTKESDIIYKIKGKDVFFIIEQQSKIDYEMPKRITEYCVELIRNVTKESRRIQVYPLIIPIVFYTGKKRWDAPRSLSDIQERYKGFEPVDYPRYNLVDINDFSKEELIKENTAISKAMLFEKIKTKEEMKEVLEILFRKNLAKEENKCLHLMLEYSNDVRKKLSEEERKMYQEKINKGGERTMTVFEEYIIDLIDKRNEAQEEAKRAKNAAQQAIQKAQKATQKAQKEGMMQVIKEMLKKQLSDEIIMDTTKISKKDLQKIKEEG